MEEGKKIYDIVIVGAGPAGIGVATEATKKGIKPDKIILLEKEEDHSWSIRRFYPESKLVTANYKGNSSQCEGSLCIPDLSKQETLEYLDQVIEENNINIRYNESVYGLERLPQGGFIIKTGTNFYHSKTCVIAIGILGRPNKPDFKIPSSLKQSVSYDITSAPIKNKNVLVVGGGDSASEYVQFLVEDGNKVSLSYRRSVFSRMNEINREKILDLEKHNKVKIYYGSSIEKIIDDQGPLVMFKEAEYDSLKFDHVVLALGGSTPVNFLKCLGIELKGSEPVLKSGYETTVSGLYLVGDLSSGKKGGSIITAFNSAHRAINKMCESSLMEKLIGR